MPPPEERTPHVDPRFLLIATAVLLVELAATYGSLTGEPLDLLAGWTTTREVDAFSFAAVVAGCTALYWCRACPVAALAVSTAAFVSFLWRDHELGLFLAPMAALYAAAVHRAPRTWALASIAAGVGVSLLWVHRRVAEVTEPGAAMLAWVAFPTVILVFLAGSYMVGELVRCHRELTTGPAPVSR